MKKIIILAALISIVFSCGLFTGEKSSSTNSKDDTFLKGIVFFTFGTVTGTKKDGASAQMKVKDVVLPGQTIVTGPKSFVTLQIGEIAVIKIKENSTVVFNEIATELKTSLNLKSGSVLSKVEKLKKGENFSVYSQTLLAAVRGTEFEVSTDTAKTRISLKSGKIAVHPLTKTEKPEVLAKEVLAKMDGKPSELVIDEGKTVDAVLKVNKTTLENEDIKVRPITPEEKSEVEKISLVPVITEHNKKTIEDMQKLQEEVKIKEEEIDKRLLKSDAGGKPDASNKIAAIINKKSRTIAEMKQVFTTVNRFSLYNGKKVEGAVLNRRGNKITVLTTTGQVTITKEEVENENPL